MPLLIIAAVDALLTILVFHNKTKEQKKSSLFLFYAGMFPFIYLLLMCITAYMEGTGLFGVYDPYDFENVLFVIVVAFTFYWFIFIPALIVVIASIVRLHKTKK